MATVTARLTKHPKARYTGQYIPDTKRCPDCNQWFLQDDGTSHYLSSYERHIQSEHPDLPARQEEYAARVLFLLPPGVSTSEFFRTYEEEERVTRMATATAEKPTREKKAKPEAAPCLDGCGMNASPGSRFLPGHDARLKSRLAKIEEGTIREDVPASIRPLLKGDDALFKGRFAKMAEAGWKQPPAPPTKPSSGKKAATPDTAGDQAQAKANLANTAKANGAGAAARKAAANK